MTFVTEPGYADAMTAAALERSRPGLWTFAGLLAALCVALFLAAVEHRPTLDTWRALRESASDLRNRISLAVTQGRATSPRAETVSRAASGPVPASSSPRTWRLPDLRPATAASPADILLDGHFVAADEATHGAFSTAAFDGGRITLGDGSVLRTAPLEIAAGRDRFGPGQSYAQRLRAPGDAQIELRRVMPARGHDAAAPLAACGGRAPHVVGLLHREDRLDLMVFRRPRPADRAPSDVLCGIWRFRAG